MNYIILDLEATCQEDNSNFNQETIEIGAVKLDKNLKIISYFNKFIKPKINNKLTDYCKNLTSITQNDVDKAEEFIPVISQFKNWINLEEDYILFSWGYYDKVQLIKDCQSHNLEFYWLEKHISLKHQFSPITNRKKLCGMKKALNILNLKLEGTHHRGIDDAKNLSKIFLKIFNELKL